jgi:hypothetical protein
VSPDNCLLHDIRLDAIKYVGSDPFSSVRIPQRGMRDGHNLPVGR